CGPAPGPPPGGPFLSASSTDAQNAARPSAASPVTADELMPPSRRRIVSRYSAGTATGCGAAFAPDFAAGTSRLNSRAALRPRMLRLACSLRNGSLVMELGASKSQCGQSDA